MEPTNGEYLGLDNVDHWELLTVFLGWEGEAMGLGWFWCQIMYPTPNCLDNFPAL